MKHLFVSLLAAVIIAPAVHGQNEDEIRATEIGVSFNLYDFKTAQLIRQNQPSGKVVTNTDQKPF